MSYDLRCSLVHPALVASKIGLVATDGECFGCRDPEIGAYPRSSGCATPLRMAAAAAARPSSVSSCTSEIDAKPADAFSFCMDISLEAGAKRSGEGVAMLGYESFNGERGPSPDLFDEIVSPGEHPVRVVDGDLSQVLHQELAAGPAGNTVGFGIK
jgi:hypothetical protein